MGFVAFYFYSKYTIDDIKYLFGTFYLMYKPHKNFLRATLGRDSIHLYFICSHLKLGKVEINMAVMFKSVFTKVNPTHRWTSL